MKAVASGSRFSFVTIVTAYLAAVHAILPRKATVFAALVSPFVLWNFFAGQNAFLTAALIGFPRHLSQHVGGFVISRGPLAELVPYIDWTFFFHAWELKGKYPAILSDEKVGKEASKLYADAQAFVFCSAALSRKTMEADPANAALCPYRITLGLR